MTRTTVAGARGETADPSSIVPDAEAPDARSDRIAGVLAAGGAAISLGLGASSPEGVLQFDDLTHYLYSAWAWQWPIYLLDEWGRPGFTALYFLPAKLGWPACRALSAVLAGFCAWWAYRLAQRLGMARPWGAAAICWTLPLFFQSSMTTLTETALAFYLTGAAWLAVRRRWAWSAAVLSVGFVTRHEAIVFLPVWIGAAWMAGARLRRLWPIAWAPLSVNGMQWLLGARPALDRLLESRPSNLYGHGSWLTFFARSIEAFGPAAAALAIVGLWALMRRGRSGADSGRRPGHKWEVALVAGCVVVYFTAQTVIRALGLFDSGGYARFLVPIGPLVAIFALAGWRALRDAEAPLRRRAVLLATAAVVVLWIALERQLALFRDTGNVVAGFPEVQMALQAVRIATGVVFVAAVCGWALGRRRPGGAATAIWMMPAVFAAMHVLTAYAMCGPLPRPQEAALIDEAIARLEAEGRGRPRVISAVTWIDYATGRAYPPGKPPMREEVEQAPIGAVIAWERQFGGCPEQGLELEELRDSASFRLIHKSGPLRLRTEPYLWLFEKVGAWNPRGTVK